MNANTLFETDRLIIRHLQPYDDKGMFLMDSDPKVHSYVGKKPVKTVEETRAVIDFIRQQYLDFGMGRWAVIEKSTNEFVGWTGFKHMIGPANGHTNFCDFGYRLAHRFWGKGYATESGLAAVKYGLRILKLQDIYAMTDVDNIASRRVLEKTGFKLMEIFNYDAEPNWREPGQPTTWYQYIHPSAQL